MRSTKAWTSARLTVFLFWNELAGEGHGSKTAMDGTKCQITNRSKQKIDLPARLLFLDGRVDLKSSISSSILEFKKKIALKTNTRKYLVERVDAPPIDFLPTPITELHSAKK